uniref:Uncharacterized protein n=1 Tax=Arundo donax TaxID=35708 RepID=A0A0A9SJ18_ARUDO
MCMKCSAQEEHTIQKQAESSFSAFLLHCWSECVCVILITNRGLSRCEKDQCIT